MHAPIQAQLGLNLLQANHQQAALNQHQLDHWGIACLNLMSGPGAGKTSLLESTLARLQEQWRLGVIEGDMTTDLDAERLRRLGVPVIAINTGRACHLDAHMVAGGLQQLQEMLDPTQVDLLLVENVGNLVCPAEFAVGEHAKVALLSVTEGEDKPLKYPIMFREADCLLITKIDLAPYVGVDVQQMVDNIQQVNPGVPILQVSARTGAGLSLWCDWIQNFLADRHQCRQERRGMAPLIKTDLHTTGA